MTETNEAVGHLVILADILETHGLGTRTDFACDPPTLIVSNPQSPASATLFGVTLSERISVEQRNGSWAWCWSWGDKVAFVTEPAKAADRIRHVLRMPTPSEV